MGCPRERRQVRLEGPYAESLEPASELHARLAGEVKFAVSESMAQACVKGMKDGCVCAN